MGSNNGANKGNLVRDEKTPAEPEKTIKMEEIKETKPRRGSGFSIPYCLVDPYTGEVLEQYEDLSDGGYWEYK